MKALVVGNGGREAALAWKLAQSPLIDEVYVTPVHPAATLLSPKIRSSSLKPEALCVEHSFGLCVVGPEVPLNEGITDRLRRLGVPTVGPTAAAAQLECSKHFAKEVMEAAGVPTARSASFIQASEALSFVAHNPEFLVVKVDGPAAGKGVVVADSVEEAQRAIRGFFDGTTLDFKASMLVLEEKMAGPELSAFALCSGLDCVWLGEARDHKRLRDGDQGPNTGGMGTLSPVSDLTGEERSFILEKVFRPTLGEMQRRGTPFQGFLFAGIMRTPQGLKVLEFNTRLGDPETQVLLPLMEDDLVPTLLACAQGQTMQAPRLSSRHALHVVLAAPGYPGTEGVPVQTGDSIQFHPFPSEDLLVFPAGLSLVGEEWISRAGRILGVTALGSSLEEAREKALAQIEKLSFPGAQWRRDIGVER